MQIHPWCSRRKSLTNLFTVIVVHGHAALLSLFEMITWFQDNGVISQATSNLGILLFSQGQEEVGLALPC